MNRRQIILAGTISIGFICLSAMILLAQAGNIIPNPDFDDSSGWYWNDWNPYSHALWDASHGHDAPGCADLFRGFYDEDLYGPVWVPSTVFTVYQGQSYEGSFWVEDYTDSYSPQYGCTNGPYLLDWAVYTVGNDPCSPNIPRNSCNWVSAWGYGTAILNTFDWEEHPIEFSAPVSTTEIITGQIAFYVWWDNDDEDLCGSHYIDDVYIYPSEPITPTVPPGGGGITCNLENYSFDEGVAGWTYGDWVIEGPGFVELHGNVNTLSSWIAQTVELTSTGPSEYYQLSMLTRSVYPVAPESAPYIRWKLNTLVPGTTPYWFQGQDRVTSWGAWQFNTWVLRNNNSPAISDTLTIWASGGDVQIDNVCITLISGYGTATPVCPPSPTYTPMPTYTPRATPTPGNDATATAWAATATAWPIQTPYPTQPAPNCAAGGGPEPGFDFIWLAGQILGFLGAFFEAIFRLLGTVLQPIFDLIGFVVWLLGAAFSLIARLIDLVPVILQFLLSLLGIAFDILGIIAAFFIALWNMISTSPVDPGFEIPTDWAWPIAAWNFLIDGTPLELLEPVAMGIGSLLMIRWTIGQFSSGEE